MIEELFIAHKSIAWPYFQELTYPYEILPKIKDIIVEIGKNLSNEYIQKSENIWIHQSAKVAESSEIHGPCIIDAGAELRHNCFIRENVIVGKNCVIGNSCELKNAIIFDNCQIPHFNYVGDSVLGNYVHLGAGVILANVKGDKKDVTIATNPKIETHLRKVGSFLGDNTEIGCQSVLNPGNIVGPNCTIYPLSNVRGVIPQNHIFKDKDTIIVKENR